MEDNLKSNDINLKQDTDLI